MILRIAVAVVLALTWLVTFRYLLASDDPPDTIAAVFLAFMPSIIVGKITLALTDATIRSDRDQ